MTEKLHLKLHLMPRLKLHLMPRLKLHLMPHLKGRIYLSRIR